MRPVLATFDLGNGPDRNAEPLCDLPLSQSLLAESSDFTNLLLGQFGRRVSTTEEKRTMPPRIFTIIAPRAPTQVDQPIVCRITVAVTAFHPWRAWSNECLEDKVVNEPPSCLARTVQVNKEMATQRYIPLDLMPGSEARTGRLAAASTTTEATPERTVRTNPIGGKAGNLSVLDFG